jgi:hypothetical protein
MPPMIQAPVEAPVMVSVPAMNKVIVGAELAQAERVRGILQGRYGTDKVWQLPGTHEGRAVAAFEVLTLETQQEVVDFVRRSLQNK